MACPNHPERVSGLVGCGRCGLGYCSDCLVTVQGRPYCASCKDAQLRDLAAGPTVELARPGSRFVAQLVLKGGEHRLARRLFDESHEVSQPLAHYFEHRCRHVLPPLFTGDRFN